MPKNYNLGLYPLGFTAYLIFKLVKKQGLFNWIDLGMCHGDEILMLFNLGVLSNMHKAHRDYEMSQSVVKLWTEFAYGE